MCRFQSIGICAILVIWTHNIMDKRSFMSSSEPLVWLVDRLPHMHQAACELDVAAAAAFPSAGRKQGRSEVQGLLLSKFYSELHAHSKRRGNVRPSFEKQKRLGSVSGRSAKSAHLVEMWRELVLSMETIHKSKSCLRVERRLLSSVPQLGSFLCKNLITF